MRIKNHCVKELLTKIESGKITTMVAMHEDYQPTAYLCIVHMNDVMKVEEAFLEVDMRVEASLVSKNSFKDSE
ncbi:MAG TPA: hypothetical protein VMW50_05075 [Dehalococcoidia bacterium]|nr:hypothetical protein [Dehalococcoidia bacterium]